MYKKPRIVNFISLVFIALSTSACVHAQNIDYVLLVLGIAGAFLTWMCSPFLMLMQFTLTVVVAVRSTAPIELSYVLLNLCLFIQLLWFMNPLRALYIDPSLHWWKTPKRIPTESRAILKTQDGSHFTAWVRNVSKEGLLLSIVCKEKPLLLFDKGTFVEVRFLLGKQHLVRCTAKIVREQPAEPLASESFPTYGLKIIYSDNLSQCRIQKCLEKKNYRHFNSATLSTPSQNA